MQKQYSYQEKAEKKYLAKANSVKISSNKKTDASLKKAVREGRISGSLKTLIATYGEKTANKIQNYQDYWDKAQDQKKSKEETKQAMRQNKSDRYQLHIDDADAYEFLQSGYQQKTEPLYGSLKSVLKHIFYYNFSILINQSKRFHLNNCLVFHIFTGSLAKKSFNISPINDRIQGNSHMIVCFFLFFFK